MSFSDILAILGLVVSLIGIPLTFILARRGRQKPDVAYAVDFTVLIRPFGDLLDRGLKLTFDDRDIRRVSRTRFAVWNRRGDTVRGSDIVESDPFRIELTEGDEILQARIVSRSRKQIGAELGLDYSREKEAVSIGFDFLDPGDGVIIEIVHQGTQAPKVAGTIRGATVAKVQDIDLTPKALELAGIRSPMRRFIKKARNRRFAVRAFAMIAPIGSAGYIIVDYIRRLGAGHLVDPKQYNLNSLEGQAAFAIEVRDTGIRNYGLLENASLGILVLAVAFMFITEIASRKRLIPSTLLGEILEERREAEVDDAA
ncbi:hypothetical protein ABZ860_28080 [Microbispora sp. NPDC046973]|uniref:hypothetical protein n=1 Tax=Microbispora sp. NPDC046973 TaxID=3155022 RepID=UPI003406DDF4